jgi:hypothetical protein
VGVNQTGVRYFCSFSDGVVRANPSAAIGYLRRHCNADKLDLPLAKHLRKKKRRHPQLSFLFQVFRGFAIRQTQEKG